MNARSKSLPRHYTEPPTKSKHHKYTANGSLKLNGNHNHTYNGMMNGKHNDYYERKNSHLTNGAAQREHLNPLANAYFAKQMQQQQNSTRDSSRSVLRQKNESSLGDLSSGPVFQSEAARQIISEISAGSASEDTEKIIEKVPSQHKHRRAVPREKRRHYTAPNNVNMKAMESVQAENDMNRNVNTFE